MTAAEKEAVFAAAKATQTRRLTREEFLVEYAKGPRADMQLDLDPRIDMTAPIQEQVTRLEKLDKAAERRRLRAAEDRSKAA